MILINPLRIKDADLKARVLEFINNEPFEFCREVEDIDINHNWRSKRGVMVMKKDGTKKEFYITK